MENKSVSKIQEYSLTSAGSILNLATELTRFIQERQLTMKIQGKDYVLVEAWTFAGMSMGLVPVPTDLINESTPDEIKYRAVVELLNIHTGQVVGRGFSICSNKEQGKKFFAEYAIASMAQTRATGKAYRLPLGFLMKAAGFEATPAEEMDYEKKPEAPAQQTKQPTPEVKNTDQPAQSAPSEPEKADQKPVAIAIKYASAKQKEEIIRLLNYPVITRQEKTKMLLNINKLDEERATQAIAKLKKVIKERENGAPVGGGAALPGEQ